MIRRVGKQAGLQASYQIFTNSPCTVAILGMQGYENVLPPSTWMQQVQETGPRRALFSMSSTEESRGSGT